MLAPSGLVRALRRLRRRTLLARWAGASLRWSAAAACMLACAALLLRAGWAWESARAAWVFAPLALVPVAAFVLARRRALDEESCAAWLDLRAGARGLLLAARESPDERWTARVEAALARAPELPRLALGRPSALFVAALAFAALTLLVPVARPAAPPAGGFFERVAVDLSERLAELAADVELDPELLEDLTQGVERLTELAREGGGGESFLEASDSLAKRLQQTALEAAASIAAVDGALGELARRAAEDPSTVHELLDAAAERLAGSGLAAERIEELRAMLEGVAGESSMLRVDASALRGLGRELVEGFEAGASRLGRDVGERIAQLREGMRERLAALRDSGLLAEGLPREPAAGSCSACGAGDCAGAQCAGSAAIAGTKPGVGGVSRGRADAALTWGDETSEAAARFREHLLPPGTTPDPEHTAPMGVVRRAPELDPRVDSPAEPTGASGGPAGVAWQRRLAPRQREAVRRFFVPSPREPR